MAPNETVEFLRSLRQVRRFKPDPVPDGAIADILRVARWTGSAMNQQPWELIVLRERATLARLGAIGQSARHLIDAPAAIVILMPGAWALEPYDEGRLTERIMLAAKAHGLGAGIGWFNTAPSTAAAKTLLGVPADRTLRTAIAIGYPAEARRRPSGADAPRKSVKEFAFDGRFGTSVPDAWHEPPGEMV